MFTFIKNYQARQQEKWFNEGYVYANNALSMGMETVESLEAYIFENNLDAFDSGLLKAIREFDSAKM